MRFNIGRESHFGEQYNGIWVVQKPCKYASPKGNIYNISERDFADKKKMNGRIYEDEELAEMSTTKREYSEGWEITLNTIADLQKLMKEVGEIIISPSGNIRIRDDW